MKAISFLMILSIGTCYADDHMLHLYQELSLLTQENDMLRQQVFALQTEIAELKQQYSQLSEDYEILSENLDFCSLQLQNLKPDSSGDQDPNVDAE